MIEQLISISRLSGIDDFVVSQDNRGYSDKEFSVHAGYVEFKNVDHRWVTKSAPIVLEILKRNGFKETEKFVHDLSDRSLGNYVEKYGATDRKTRMAYAFVLGHKLWEKLKTIKDPSEFSIFVQYLNSSPYFNYSGKGFENTDLGKLALDTEKQYHNLEGNKGHGR